MARALSILAGFAAFFAGAAHALEPSPDRYDPARLQAIAIEHARAGDWSAAAIAIERAARLSPHDARVVRDRDDIRARRAPAAPPAPVPAISQAAPAKKPAVVAPEPPPLWARPR